MTSHCRECGSRLCNHGNCPECAPCKHCNGGDRSDKFFGYDHEHEKELDQDHGLDGWGHP